MIYEERNACAMDNGCGAYCDLFFFVKFVRMDVFLRWVVFANGFSKVAVFVFAPDCDGFCMRLCCCRVQFEILFENLNVFLRKII